MKLWLPILFCFLFGNALAQQKEVNGIIFDKESKARIAKVNIRNTATGQAVYDNFKGEFTIKASIGDKLIFSKADHHPDTVIIKDYLPLAVYLRAIAIQLNEVSIRDTLLNPQRRFLATKSEYSKIYGSAGNRDLLSLGQGGVGFSIDGLYNMFSRSGKNAAHLQEVIERDYKQSVIDHRFNKTFVAGITLLKDPKLSDFMLKYRPGYYLVTTANEYDFISYIRTSLKRYKRNPKAFELSPLPLVYIK